MRFWLKLAGAALLVVVLLQALLWFSASRQASKLVAALQPLVELEHGGSYAWLSGRAGLNNVRVRSPMLPDGELTAAAIELDAGGPVGLLSMLWLDGDEPPADLAIGVRQLRLSQGLERRLRDAAARQGYLAPFEALGCNERGRFDGVDYAELGWLQSQADLTLRSRRPTPTQWNLALAHDMQPLGRTEIEMDLRADGAPRPTWAAIGTSLRPERIEMRFDDRGMLAARNAYCARRLGIEPDAFLDRHVDAVSAELEAGGIFPDPPVTALYREFAERGGNLALTVTPSRSIAFADYHHYSAADQLGLLNPSLRLDGGPPVPVTARFFSDGAGAGAVRDSGVGAVRVQADASGADVLSFEELAEFTGRRLAVKTREGQAYVGTLLGTQGPLVRLEIVQRSGRSQRLALSRNSIESLRLAD